MVGVSVGFEIDDQRVLALNGGPQFKVTPALSLIVNCDDQAEIDMLWQKLAEGGAHRVSLLSDPGDPRRRRARAETSRLSY